MNQEKKTNPFYITTPIYYVNAKPHLGHAYTTIAADVAARFNTMVEKETYFLTGTDEHGEKIVEAAEKEGLSPKKYVDKISSLFKDLWPDLNISNDHFIRTTDPEHIKTVELVLQTLYDRGEIYFNEYEGLYCVGCERYYQERELVDGKCPDHQKEPKRIKESNYFFRMSHYQQWLIDHIHENPDFIRPERYKNEVLSFLKEPLGDLCISSPKSRLEWGITLPFDDNFVTYVWVDALSNYLTAVGYPNQDAFKKFWPHAQHLVAKDILKTHGIYWPTLLKAAGIEPYKHLNVHGFWNMGKSKMSKSLGNVADPMSMKDKYGIDAFRFFLMRDMVFGLDSDYSEKALVGRLNSDLANDLGNLVNRIISMVHRYFDGILHDTDSALEQQENLCLKDISLETVESYCSHMDRFAFHDGLSSVWKLISHLNKYIDTQAPWALAKQENDLPKLKTVMYNLVESLRIISGLIYPVMPDTSRKIQGFLGQKNDSFFNLSYLSQWGLMQKDTLLKKPDVLFPRVEFKEEVSEEPSISKLNDLKPEISFDDFSKIDLRVGLVLEASEIPKSKKLLKLKVDIGEQRTIVAGIKSNYTKEDIIGKQVVVVANLKEAKLMGVQSQGMVLAATVQNKPYILSTGHEIKPGTVVK